MKFRWLNSFNVLAVILLLIGIVGAVEGPKMTFDPGRPTSAFFWVVYVVAGVLMLINGLLPPANADGDEDGKPTA
jgi:hypothetical protein